MQPNFFSIVLLVLISGIISEDPSQFHLKETEDLLSDLVCYEYFVREAKEGWPPENSLLLEISNVYYRNSVGRAASKLMVRILSRSGEVTEKGREIVAHQFTYSYIQRQSDLRRDALRCEVKLLELKILGIEAFDKTKLAEDTVRKYSPKGM